MGGFFSNGMLGSTGLGHTSLMRIESGCDDGMDLD